MQALERDLFLRATAINLGRETVWTQQLKKAQRENDSVDKWVRENL
jgi:hypothetical protein